MFILRTITFKNMFIWTCSSYSNIDTLSVFLSTVALVVCRRYNTVDILPSGGCRNQNRNGHVRTVAITSGIIIDCIGYIFDIMSFLLYTIVVDEYVYTFSVQGKPSKGSPPSGPQPSKALDFGVYAMSLVSFMQMSLCIHVLGSRKVSMGSEIQRSYGCLRRIQKIK